MVKTLESKQSTQSASKTSAANLGEGTITAFIMSHLNWHKQENCRLDVRPVIPGRFYRVNTLQVDNSSLYPSVSFVDSRFIEVITTAAGLEIVDRTIVKPRKMRF